MDVKSYFRKIREMEASISERFLVIVSKATVDGGQEGVYSEVPRFVACQLVVEGRARIASTDEAEQYRAEQKLVCEELERNKEDNRGTFNRQSSKTPGKVVRT